MMSLDDNTTSPHSHDRSRSQSRTPLHGFPECPVCVFEALEIPRVTENALPANDPTNDDILPSLRISLDAVRSVSRSVEQCIASMASALSRMHSAKATCALAIKQHEAAIQPIRHLPDDILLNIFEWHTWSQTRRQNRAPWTLSYVSRRWRALVLSTASLWSNIDVPLRALMNEEALESLASQWNVVLQRSMDSDLFVRLILDVSSVDKFTHVLPPTTRRWKHLVLSTGTLFPALLNHCDFDRLTKLELLGGRLHTETLSMFTRAPNLSCLTLNSDVEIDVLWDRITSYTCDFEGLRYLHRFSALEHLELNFISVLRDMASPFPSEVSVPLSLPTLRSLSIYHPTRLISPIIQGISKRLHLPSLTSLMIFSGPHTLPLFAGPLPHLRELCLRSTADPDEVFSFFGMHNAVTSLHIRTVEVLRVVVDSPILFPNLTILSVDADLLTRHPNSVINVLEERCRQRGRHVAQLLELRIWGTQKAIRAAAAVYGRRERWHNVLKKIKVVEAKCPYCV